MKSWGLIIASVVGFFVLPACMREGDLRVIDQTRQAGELVEKHPESPPVVKQAGKDIRENMEVVQEETGPPEKKVAYTPEESHNARETAKQEHKEPPAVFSFVADIVKPWAPWASSALMFGWGLYEKVKKSGMAKKLVAVYQGVENLKSEVAKNDALPAEEWGPMTMDEMNKVMRDTAGQFNVYTGIKSDLAKLKEDGVVSEAKVPPPAVAA